MGGCCGAMKSSQKSMPGKDKQPRSKNNTLTRNNETKSKNDKKAEANGKTTSDAKAAETHQDSNAVVENATEAKLLVNPFEANDKSGEVALVKETIEAAEAAVEEEAKVAEAKAENEGELIANAVLIVEEAIKQSVQQECIDASQISQEIIQEVAQEWKAEVKISEPEEEEEKEKGSKDELVAAPEIQTKDEVAVCSENAAQPEKDESDKAERLVQESKCLNADFTVQEAAQEKVTIAAEENEEKASETSEAATDSAVVAEQVHAVEAADDKEDVCLPPPQSTDESSPTSDVKDEKPLVKETSQEVQSEQEVKPIESVEIKEKECEKSNSEASEVSEIVIAKCQEHMPVEPREVVPQPMQCVLEESHLDETVTLAKPQECSFAPNFETPAVDSSEQVQKLPDDLTEQPTQPPATQEPASSTLEVQGEADKIATLELVQKEDVTKTCAPECSQMPDLVQQIETDKKITSVECAQSNVVIVEKEVDSIEVSLTDNEANKEQPEKVKDAIEDCKVETRQLEDQIEVTIPAQPKEEVIAAPEATFAPPQTESEISECTIESSENVAELEKELVKSEKSAENIEPRCEVTATTPQTDAEITPMKSSGCIIAPASLETNKIEITIDEVAPKQLVEDIETSASSDCQATGEKQERAAETIGEEAMKSETCTMAAPVELKQIEILEFSTDAAAVEKEPVKSAEPIEAPRASVEVHQPIAECCQRTEDSKVNDVVLESEETKCAEVAEGITQKVEEYSNQLVQDAVEDVLTGLSPATADKEAKSGVVPLKPEAASEAIEALPLPEPEKESLATEKEEKMASMPIVEITLPACQEGDQSVDSERLPPPPSPEELMFPQSERFPSEGSLPSSQDSFSLPSPPEDHHCQGLSQVTSQEESSNVPCAAEGQPVTLCPEAATEISSKIYAVSEVAVESTAESHKCEEKKIE